MPPDVAEQLDDYSAALPPSTQWRQTIKTWLAEDIPTFDFGGLVVGDKIEVAYMYGKTTGILAGVPFADAVFEEVGCTVEWMMKEGELVDTAAAENGKVVVAKVTGPARRLLVAERLALNIVSRCSGIATACRAMSDLKTRHGWHGEIAATRKVTPGFRFIEKYGVLVGGCSTHRMDLSHMVSWRSELTT